MLELIKKSDLKNPYYYVNDNVLYAISDTQMDENLAEIEDKRIGEHLVVYVTEEQELAKGTKYRDLHNDEQTALVDGLYQVSTNKINVEECKAIFPYCTVSYEDDDSNTYEEIYWLQDYIKVGDKFVNGHFESYHSDYQKDYENKAIVEIGKLIDKGTNLNQIISKFPYYIFDSAMIEDKVKINTEDGQKMVTYNGVEGVTTKSTKDMKDIIAKSVQDKTVAFANQKLDAYNLKVTDDAIDINSSTVVDK